MLFPRRRQPVGRESDDTSENSQERHRLFRDAEHRRVALHLADYKTGHDDEERDDPAERAVGRVQVPRRALLLFLLLVLLVVLVLACGLRHSCNLLTRLVVATRQSAPAVSSALAAGLPHHSPAARRTRAPSSSLVSLFQLVFRPNDRTVVVTTGRQRG